MRGRKKRSSTPGNSGKQLKPRRGEQAKQNKAPVAKEMEIKGARQTKLAFAATGTLEKTTVPIPASANETTKTVHTKTLSFAEATRTPPKAKETNDNAQSTAITPEPKKDLQLLPKVHHLQSKT
jgi:hypothetical protein